MSMFWVILGLVIFSFRLNGEIYRLKIDGPIDSITEEYIVDSFKEIKENRDAKLIIIEMDTPGGFSTSMRTIIKEIMGSTVPVASYVYPKGAQAASAGFLILIASDIAIMSPGTNTGAAHPVSVAGDKIDETMNKKITNDAGAYARSLAKSRSRNEDLSEKAVRESLSYTAEECLKSNLIEYIAPDIRSLIDQLDNKTITMINGKSISLKIKNDRVVVLDLSGRQKFLKTITNPNLAYILIIIGLLGLYLEFTHPGILIPGVVGGICLVLSFLAFQVLPMNYVGLLLIILSMGFFIAEIKIQGFGMLGIGGIISFVLGSVMLINAPIPEMRPAMTTIIATTLTFCGIILFLAYKVIKAMKHRTETGQEGMIGELGTARSVITGTSGKVFVHGEWWNAVSASGETIPEGSKVKVDRVDGFTLKVSFLSNQ